MKTDKQFKQEFKVEWVAVEKIKRYDNNPRKNDKSVKEVMKSIEEFGPQQPLVVDPLDSVIIVGDTRFQAFIALGYPKVPVKWADDLSEAQKKAYRVMDNRTGEHSVWDMDKLLAEIGTIGNLVPKFDAAFLGFEVRELTTKEEKWSLDKSYVESVITVRVPLERQAEVMDKIKTIEGAIIDVSNVKRFRE